MRKRTDRLRARSPGPRESEALRLIEQHPGITIEELADALGVSMSRVWQIVGRLEASRVHRERDYHRKLRLPRAGTPTPPRAVAGLLQRGL
jgi:DNA-binding MarR family transcriptional regulator